MRTRSQEDLILAAGLVAEVGKLDPAVQGIYGGLCHGFPILVRTCGLCQALAFSTAKAAGSDGPRKEAHQRLLAHIAAILGHPEADALEIVRKADVMEYIRHTRRVLSAWIYFKRFAVSILKVESARDAEEGGDGG